MASRGGCAPACRPSTTGPRTPKPCCAGASVLGQRLPLASGPEYVKDGVEHLAHLHRPRTPAAIGRPDQGATSAHSAPVRSLGNAIRADPLPHDALAST